MKLRDYRRSESTIAIYPKQIKNKIFQLDDNEQVKKIRVANGRKDNIRYSVKILIDGSCKKLVLTQRALDNLAEATSSCPGTVKYVRFDGKQGDKKSTHWLFTVVDKNQKKQEPGIERPSITSFMH